MIRRFATLTAVFVALFACASGSAQARPVVDMGTLPVGVCNVQVKLDGCLVRRIWFSNHTDTPIVIGSVTVHRSDVFDYELVNRSRECFAQFGIPAHSSCFVTVHAGPLIIGQTRGSISLDDVTTGLPLRMARLMVTGT